MVVGLMVKLSMRKTNHTTNIIIFIAWFMPIFGAPQVQGFREYGLDLFYAKALYVCPVLLGAAFFASVILLGKKISLNRYALALLLFIYGHSLLSDVSEYAQVFYFSLYALVVCLIGYNYPRVLFRQYFAVCGVIAALVVVDYFAYYITGSILFHWHAIGSVSGILRISTFFNEPFHQASFLMPALLYCLFCDRKGFDVWLAVLLFAYLATFSVAAILLLMVPVTYYIFKRKFTLLVLLYCFVVSMVVITVAGDYIFSKLRTATNLEMYYHREKQSTGANYIALRDIAKNTELSGLVFGVGYFNVGAVFADYLKSSDLARYYRFQGFYRGDYTSNSIIRWLYSFGILGGVVIWFLVKQMFRFSRESLISIIVIVSIILLSIKDTHALDNLVYIFFLFGLFWGDGRRNRKALQLESNFKNTRSTKIPCRSGKPA